MVRRKIRTKVLKREMQRPSHVKGTGDILYKHFQCLNPDCQSFISQRMSEISEDFDIECPACHFHHKAGLENRQYTYDLFDQDEEKIIETGDFLILHDDYIDQAPLYKHCLVCYKLRPLEHFSQHSSRESLAQGECRFCKDTYNSIKNQTRTTDQHREAAQRRRLYLQLSESSARIDSTPIFARFGSQCFNCNKPVNKNTGDHNLDHTLPAALLWPMTTKNATLLCRACNNQKHDKWPSEFYSKEKLRALASLVDYRYDLLSGSPVINADAVRKIREDVDGFIRTWIPYPNDIKKVRALIKHHASIDIFDFASHVPDNLKT